MVTLFKQSEDHQIEELVRKSTLHTEAELAAVFVRASNPYHGYLFCDGFIAGSCVSLGLWLSHTVGNYLLLLLAQIAVMAVLLLLPPFGQFFMRFIPKVVRDHAAAKSAAFEFLHLTHRLPASKPAVLLYVSVAEKYVHILPSRSMHETVPKTVWDNVVKNLTTSVKKIGLKEASMVAIKEMTEILAHYYPLK